MDWMRSLVEQLPPEMRVWVAAALLVGLILLAVWGYIVKRSDSPSS